MPTPRRPESYSGLLRSEAIDRWGYYRENSYKLFKVNVRTVTTLLVFGIGIPGALYCYCRNVQRENERLIANRLAKKYNTSKGSSD